MSKFSVKKPYTVIVALVLILVLGLVSFTRMTTDLLPDINLPYAIVITTLPGGSPSEVEEQVTKPVEEAMATISNIQNVSSVSQENMSMVILEFSQSTNMDSVSLEMRESLDQVESSWDDAIGSPIIMKLNPNMMPVMIAGIEKEGLSALELTNYVNEEMSSDIESLEGVASVSGSGEVEESISVVLSQEKIDKVNAEVQDAIAAQFYDAEKEMSDAQAELDDAKSEMETAREELDSGAASAGSQLGDAQAQISTGQAQMLETEMDLQNKLSEAKTSLEELKNKKTELESQKASLEETQATLDALPEQITQVEYQIGQIDEAVASIQSILADTATIDQLVILQETIAGLEALPSRTEEEEATLQQLKAQFTEATAGLTELGISSFNSADDLKAQLQTKISELTAGKAALTSSLGQLEEANSEENRKQVTEGLAAIKAAMPQIESGIAQLEPAITQLEDAITQVKNGQTTLSQAVATLNSQEISAIVEMAAAEAKLAVGEYQIEAGQTQLDSGKETLDGQKEAALDASDLKGTITPSMISQILTAQNFSMPAGSVTEDGISYLVRVGDDITDVNELKELVLMDLGLDDLEPIRLCDVAEVSITDNSSEVYAKLNGQDGLMLSMQKQTGYSTGEVADRLNDYFASAEEKDPDLHVTVLMDQGIYIDMIVDSVLKNLLYGALLAILILFLFLKDIRPTLIVAISIPMSVLTAIILMYFSGISLNMISLSGLALGVGMLVDNSIVVIENIYRLKAKGLPVKKAAVQGAKQMSGAIIASTLTTVCVFLPIVFTEGITRQLFTDMGLTIGYSLLASLLIAMTFVPMAAAGMLGNVKEKKSPIWDRVRKVYEKAARWALRRKLIVLAVAVVLFVVSVYAAIQKGITYMPDMESTQASVTLTMPEGSTLSDTAAMSDEVIDRLSTISDVESIGAMVSSGSSSMSLTSLTSASGDRSCSIYLLLKEDKELSGDALGEEVARLTEDLDCEIEYSASMMDLSALGGSGITVEIKGKDMDKLRSMAEDTGKILEGIEGLENVDNGLADSTEELRITVNKEKAAAYNLTVAQVYQQVYALLTEESAVSTLSTDTYEFDINVSDDSAVEYDRQDVKDMEITGTDSEGKDKKVALSKIAEFSDGQGLQAITRDAQSDYIAVSAEVADGYNATLLSTAVEERLNAYNWPDGYSYEMTGEDSTIKDALQDVGLMMLLALIFMYLIMVAQFQSVLSPFIVMFTIPLAMTGGFLGLLLTGMEVSIIALIGFVMLAGVIVNNGIVLVDYINQLRAAGVDKMEAIVRAGSTRMRPIFMTALTTVLGLAAMAVGIGMGAEMSRPMAVVTIGGLLYGTLMTLFVVPCIYDIFTGKKFRVVHDADVDMTEEEMYLLENDNVEDM